MKIRNIFESLLYAIGSFIKYTISFVIIYGLLFGFEGLKNAIYSWCIPLALGSFLGYLGGKQFIWLVELKNVIFLLFAIIALNAISAFVVRSIILNDEQWWISMIMLTLPISWGYINSVTVGLKQNIEERK